MYIQKIENKRFDKKYPKNPFCVTRLISRLISILLMKNFAIIM